ncbi:MAG TPA: VWA domain-containing protein [Thermoplasmata archaeon]|nr:VWA domain-containing protein [Thermoplasmata archaeon]
MTAEEPTPSRATFLGRLSAFCALVRARGVPVGIGSEADLAAAALAVDLLDRPTFRAACLATLAKSPEELETVAEAFDEFWGGAARASATPWTGAGTAVVRPPRGRPHRRTAEPRVPRAPDIPDVAVPFGTWSASAPAAGHRPLGRSAREVRGVREGARRLRGIVATLPGRRHEHAHRGTVDLRDTLWGGLRHGGEWLELRRQRPRLRRGEFVVMWDVSGSMREHEGECFSIAHALASVSRGAHVFAFSTTLTEITEPLRRHTYRRAAEAVGARIDRADGGTRIGRSLGELAEHGDRVVRDRSTVVVLSDGWDLGEPERTAEALAQLGSRAHAIVWVNPYARRTGFEPRVGALRAALPYLDLLWGPEDFLRPHPPRSPPSTPVVPSPV